MGNTVNLIINNIINNPDILTALLQHMISTQYILTSLLETLGRGNGVVKSMSLSISDMSSANPCGSVVSPAFACIDSLLE